MNKLSIRSHKFGYQGTVDSQPSYESTVESGESVIDSRYDLELGK